MSDSPESLQYTTDFFNFLPFLIRWTTIIVRLSILVVWKDFLELNSTIEHLICQVPRSAIIMDDFSGICSC